MNEGRPVPIFNAIHDTYDNIMTTQVPAERFIENILLMPGQRVLDVACGTGWATMAAARIVDETGKVIGIDVADKLLNIAREKAISEGLSNVEYQIGDAEALEFKDESYDAVLCASSIFLFKDIPKALREWKRVLRFGGIVAFSSFGEDFLAPFAALFLKRLSRYDGQPSPNERFGNRVNTPEKCRALLTSAGFENIKIITEQAGFYFRDTTAYWREMSSMITRLRLDRLSPDKRKKFKREHLAEIEPLCTDEGYWMEIPAIFSFAIK